MNLKITNKNGITLYTAKKYIKENINVVLDDSLIPSGTLDITENGEHIVTDYEKVNVQVESGVNITDADATPADLLLGKVAYNNDGKIEGTIETYDYSNSEEVSPEIDKFITGQMTEYYNDRVTTLATYAMRPISTNIVKLSFPNLIQSSTSFFSCSKLTEVYLPKLEKTSNQEFQNCTSLYVVEMPNVTRLEMQTFNGCKALEKLEFNNLIYIANTSFTSCTAFKTLILRGDTVCQLAGTSPYFKDTLIASGEGHVYVKDELVEQYKIATNWSTIASQIRPLSEYVEGE